MRKIVLMIIAAICAGLILAGCQQQQTSVPLAAGAQREEHVHSPPETDNTVEHEDQGYCGNTTTSVRRYAQGGEEKEEARSFWGGDSVTLTDILRFLDYSGDVCECLPEYTVDTEFGENFGVNLTQGFVRYDGAQVDLTSEQAEEIQRIIDGALSGKTD